MGSRIILVTKRNSDTFFGIRSFVWFSICLTNSAHNMVLDDIEDGTEFSKGDKIDDDRSMVEGLQKSFSTLTSEEQEEELERKRQAIQKLDKLAHEGSQMSKKNI